MEELSADICLKIFILLDHHNLATAQQVCRKWKLLTSDNHIWSKLFVERWGGDHAAIYAHTGVKSWKAIYEVQDRCDRVGLGLKIIREGADYYLIHQGEIQRHLGSKRMREETDLCLTSTKENAGDGFEEEGRSCKDILDKILFFIGDLEVAVTDAKRRCGE